MVKVGCSEARVHCVKVGVRLGAMEVGYVESLALANQGNAVGGFIGCATAGAIDSAVDAPSVKSIWLSDEGEVDSTASVRLSENVLLIRESRLRLGVLPESVDRYERLGELWHAAYASDE